MKENEKQERSHHHTLCLGNRIYGNAHCSSLSHGFGRMSYSVILPSMNPSAVLVNLPAIGYALRVYSRTLHRDLGTLPEWEEWADLFYGGLVGFIIALMYGLIPLLLLLLGLGLLVKGGLFLFLGMVLMVLGVLAGVFTLFFYPMAMARYIVQRRLEAAFHPGMLWGGHQRGPGGVCRHVSAVRRALHSGRTRRRHSLRWGAKLAFPMVLFAAGPSPALWRGLYQDCLGQGRSPLPEGHQA